MNEQLGSRVSLQAEATIMSRVTSKDGTAIAYERIGAGPPLILVDGALCSRAFGPMPKLAPLLAQAFTVYLYDRRGRGESGDTPPFVKDRELEDLAALIGRVSRELVPDARVTGEHRVVAAGPHPLIGHS